MKVPMFGNNSSTIVLLLIAGVWLFLSATTNAAPSDMSYNYPSSIERENLLRSLDQLKEALIAQENLQNSKRGLDLGLGRGYSGSQAAKHLMGLAAANFAGGPGRRRRSADDA